MKWQISSGEGVSELGSRIEPRPTQEEEVEFDLEKEEDDVLEDEHVEKEDEEHVKRK